MEHARCRLNAAVNKAKGEFGREGERSAIHALLPPSHFFEHMLIFFSKEGAFDGFHPFYMPSQRYVLQNFSVALSFFSIFSRSAEKFSDSILFCKEVMNRRVQRADSSIFLQFLA